MKKLICIIFLFFGVFLLNAQKSLTLEAAMELAVQHNYDLKNQALNISTVEKELEKLRAQRMPTVSGNGDVRYNPILQTSILPGDAFGQPGGAPQKIKFGTNFNLLFSLDATYKLYDAVYQTNVEINRVQNTLENATLRKNTLDVKLDAATAYYEVLLQQTQLNLANDRLIRAEDILEITTTQFQAGAALPVDLQKSELEMQNAQALLEQVQNNLQRSRLNLARLLGIGAEVIVLPANALQINADTLQKPIANTASIENRYEIQEEQNQMQINQLQIQLQDKLYLPSLELFGNLSAQHLSDDLAVWDRWFPFAYLGLRISVPIFDGNQKVRNKESYQLQMQINQNNLARLREDLNYELRGAAIDLENAMSQLRNASQNLATARGILQVDQMRYQEGALLFADFRNTEFSLREAESNFLSASQNYYVARLRWMRSSGEW